METVKTYAPVDLSTDPEIKSKYDRMICAQWVVGEADLGTVIAELTVHSHHPERKGYSASFRNITVEQRDGFTSTRYSLLFGSVALGVMPAARFSKKVLQSFFDEKLAELRERADEAEIVDVRAGGKA